LGDLKWNFLNYSKILRNLFGKFITFLKGYNADYQNKYKITNDLQLCKKKNCGELAYTRGATGE
jgi:hypothetical protein